MNKVLPYVCLWLVLTFTMLTFAAFGSCPNREPRHTAYCTNGLTCPSTDQQSVCVAAKHKDPEQGAFACDIISTNFYCVGAGKLAPCFHECPCVMINGVCQPTQMGCVTDMMEYLAGKICPTD